MLSAVEPTCLIAFCQLPLQTKNMYASMCSVAVHSQRMDQILTFTQLLFPRVPPNSSHSYASAMSSLELDLEPPHANRKPPQADFSLLAAFRGALGDWFMPIMDLDAFAGPLDWAKYGEVYRLEITGVGFGLALGADNLSTLGPRGGVSLR